MDPIQRMKGRVTDIMASYKKQVAAAFTATTINVRQVLNIAYRIPAAAICRVGFCSIDNSLAYGSSSGGGGVGGCFGDSR